MGLRPDQPESTTEQTEDRSGWNPNLRIRSSFRSSLGYTNILGDRFVALEGNYRPGIVRRKPLIHEGSTLHVNAAVKFGVLTISLLDDCGNAIQKVTIAERDNFDIPVPELTKLVSRKGQPLPLEFAILNGKLFSFWVE